jgi:hypothetical protein
LDNFREPGPFDSLLLSGNNLILQRNKMTKMGAEIANTDISEL